MKTTYIILLVIAIAACVYTVSTAVTMYQEGVSVYTPEEIALNEAPMIVETPTEIVEDSTILPVCEGVNTTETNITEECVSANPEYSNDQNLESHI